MPLAKFLAMLDAELEKNGIKHSLNVVVLGIDIPIALPEVKLAIFIDPCNDGCGCLEHYTAPEKDASAWPPDPTQCMARMERENHRIREAGWSVIRFWEHDVDRSPEAVVGEIIAGLESISDVLEI